MNHIPTNEAEVEQLIKIEAMRFGCTLMRNNSGAFKDASGRFVRFGLGSVSKKHDERIKSPDEVGFTRVVITPEMVGKTIAIFTGVEVKEPGWNPKSLGAHERAQKAWIDWIKANGGIAGFANSVDQFKQILREWGLRI